MLAGDQFDGLQGERGRSGCFFREAVSKDSWPRKICLLSYLDLRIMGYGLLAVFGWNNDLKHAKFVLLHWVGRHIPTICTDWCQLHRRGYK